MHPKKPTLVIYWTDTRVLLTYREKRDVEAYGNVVSVTPSEILLSDPMSGRMVAIRGTTDSTVPKIPAPTALA